MAVSTLAALAVAAHAVGPAQAQILGAHANNTQITALRLCDAVSGFSASSRWIPAARSAASPNWTTIAASERDTRFNGRCILILILWFLEPRARPWARSQRFLSLHRNSANCPGRWRGGRAWISKGFIPAGERQYTSPADCERPPGATRGSRDDWQGRSETAWFRATRRLGHRAWRVPTSRRMQGIGRVSLGRGNAHGIDCSARRSRDEGAYGKFGDGRCRAVPSWRRKSRDRARRWVASPNRYARVRSDHRRLLQLQLWTTVALVLRLIWRGKYVVAARHASGVAARVLPRRASAGDAGRRDLVPVGISRPPSWRGRVACVGDGGARCGAAISLWNSVRLSAAFGHQRTHLIAFVANRPTRRPEGELFRGAICATSSLSDRIDSRYLITWCRRRAEPRTRAPATERFFYRGRSSAAGRSPAGGDPGRVRDSGPRRRIFGTPLVTVRRIRFRRVSGVHDRVSSGIIVAGVPPARALRPRALAGIGPTPRAHAVWRARGDVHVAEMGATTWVVIIFLLAHERRPLTRGSRRHRLPVSPARAVVGPWLDCGPREASGDVRRNGESSQRGGGAASPVDGDGERAGTIRHRRGLWCAEILSRDHAAQPDTPFAGQGGFMRYLCWRIRCRTGATWWQTRWMNFAKRYPVHVLLFGFDHFRFKSTYEESGNSRSSRLCGGTRCRSGSGSGCWVLSVSRCSRATRRWPRLTGLFVSSARRCHHCLLGPDPSGSCANAAIRSRGGDALTCRFRGRQTVGCARAASSRHAWCNCPSYASSGSPPAESAAWRALRSLDPLVSSSRSRADSRGIAAMSFRRFAGNVTLIPLSRAGAIRSL